MSSKSPPPDALNAVSSSSLISTATGQESATTTGIPLQELKHRQHDDEHAGTATSTTPTVDRKGKGKARVVDPVDELENYDLQENPEAVEMDSSTRHGEDVFHDDVDYAEQDSGEVSPGNGAYPPMGDDDLEERRVAETLKRWEEAERQRRKALRETNRSSNSPRNSLVGDVSRRASKLWKEGAQRRTSLRRGATRLLDDGSPSRRTSTGTRGSSVTRRSGADEDGGDRNGSSLAPSRSTTLSAQEMDRERARSTSPSSPTPLVANNPFSTPRMGSPASFEDRPLSGLGYASGSKSPNPGPEDALMEGTSAPPTPAAVGDHTRAGQTVFDPEFPDRPILQASGSYSLDTLAAGQGGGATKTAGNGRRPKSTLPPPRPLDLPQEVVAAPNMTTTVPPRALSPMMVERSEVEIAEDQEIEAREAEHGRWWTDWMCGCRESGRLGQDQAGRTNPFE